MTLNETSGTQFYTYTRTYPYTQTHVHNTRTHPCNIVKRLLSQNVFRQELSNVERFVRTTRGDPY